MSQSYDVVIREASVYDGSGAPPLIADVAIDAERIAALGAVGGSARKTLDGRGLALSPGFIDVHTHDDFAALVHPEMNRHRLPQGIHAVFVNGVLSMRDGQPTNARAGRALRRAGSES